MQTYLVGGAVRDQLLKLKPGDKDWLVVGATPEQMLAEGYTQVGADFPVFLHPDSKEEYALARTERKTAAGYKGFVCHSDPSVTLEQDLLRRDLSINAMAADSSGNIIDPYGGQADLQAKLLRHVSPAFVEDPLRVLRVARFYARFAALGFRIADETYSLMREIAASGELQNLPAERLWQETQRALGEARPSAYFQCLRDSGAEAQLMPELAETGFKLLDKSLDEHLDNQQAKTVELRWSLLCSQLQEQDAQRLSQRLKAPKACADMAQLGARFSPLPDNSAEAAMAILQACDYLRRPEKLETFVQLQGLLPQKQSQSSLLEKLPSAAEALHAIKAETFAKQGIQGKALGEALAQARQEALNDLF